MLTEADIAAFRSDPLPRHRLRQSFARFLRFLGLALTGRGQIIEGDNFESRRTRAWSYYNDNWWRVRRVLTSLTVLGLEAEGRALFAWLDAPFRPGRIRDCDEESRREAARSHAIRANRVGR